MAECGSAHHFENAVKKKKTIIVLLLLWLLDLGRVDSEKL